MAATFALSGCGGGSGTAGTGGSVGLPANLTGMSVAGLVNAIEALPPLGTAVLSGRSNAAAAALK